MSFIHATIYFYLYPNVVVAQAHNATDNSTSADPSKTHIGWKSSPDGRSTMDIIWSCASVLLVCTYKCLHLNIPSFEENQAGWHVKCYILYWPEWPMVKMKLRKIKWMAIILIAPEYGVALACYQFMQAWDDLRCARIKYPDQELTLTHGFYALAGGFATSSSSGTSGGSLVQMRGEAAPIHLFELNLIAYLDICKENNLSIVTEDDLNDRSKSDFFTKLFAIFQSTWLVVQSIARVSAGLPISELELATVAYVVCAIMIYAFWWHKPFDVEHVTIVESRESNQAKVWKKKEQVTERGEAEHGLFEVLSFRDNKLSWHPTGIVVMSIATIFSGIHLAAWNWDFPGHVSRTLWRSFRVASTAAGPLLIGVMF